MPPPCPRRAQGAMIGIFTGQAVYLSTFKPRVAR
jgi:hypothetical protein